MDQHGPDGRAVVRPRAGSGHTAGWVAVGGCLLIAATAYTIAIDPHERSSVFPPCPTKLLTGLDCPLCGGLRLVHDAGHGDVSAMLHDNVFLLVLSPLLAWFAYRIVAERRAGRTYAPPRWLSWSLLAASIGWMVLRNLPFWPWKPTVYGQA